MARAKGFLSGVRRRLVAGVARARGDTWPVIQSAAAGGVAWFLAHTVLGHPHPIFAPIAAVAALSVNIGERGQRTIGMLVGVVVGVVVGQLAVSFLGTNLLEVALVIAVAMLVTRALTGSIIGLIQAGASAAIVVAMQSTAPGGERLLDALVGGGVALFVSQILFPPRPVSLLASAGREALGSISAGLQASASALADADATAAEAALERLRGEGRSSLDDLAEARETSGRVTRWTLRGWRVKGRVEELDTRLGEIDLLFASALLLIRAAHQLLEENISGPEWLQRAIEELAQAVEALAGNPESPDRRARERALEAARAVSPGTDLRFALAAEQVRLAARYVLRVAAPDEEFASAEDPNDAAGSF